MNLKDKDTQNFRHRTTYPIKQRSPHLGWCRLSVVGGRRATFPRSPAVSSPRRGLTSLFGMGRGAPPRHSRHFCLFAACPGGRENVTRHFPACLHERRTRCHTIAFPFLRFWLKGRRGESPARPRAFGPLVPLGSTSRNARTCGLSTSSSTTALQGGLISGRASRLDALSAYPVRTRLPGCAPGGTTGTP